MARRAISVGISGLALAVAWGSVRPAGKIGVDARDRPPTTRSSAPAAAGASARLDALFSVPRGESFHRVVLVTRRGATLFAAEYGTPDSIHGAPGVDAVFALPSLLRVFEATALLRLSEEGRLGLDQPAIRILPELRGWGEAITARQLLQQTAGLPERLSGDLTAQKGSTAPPPSASTLETIATRLRVQGLATRPGTRFGESAVGDVLLAALLERVSGLPLADVLGSRVFRPGGMTVTAFAHRKDLWPNPAGRVLLSSARDLARFDRALSRGDLLHASSLRQMFSPGRLADGELLGYGLGWEIVADPATGATGFAQGGGDRGSNSYYLRLPEDDLSVLILANGADADLEPLAFAAASLSRP